MIQSGKRVEKAGSDRIKLILLAGMEMPRMGARQRREKADAGNEKPSERKAAIWNESAFHEPMLSTEQSPCQAENEKTMPPEKRAWFNF
jgi:hypothetical protein